MKAILLLLLLIAIIDCKKETPKTTKALKTTPVIAKPIEPTPNIEKVTDTIVKVDSVITKSDLSPKILKQRADTSDLHFSFTLTDSSQSGITIYTGYTSYSDDEFEFENPAYLKVYNSDTLLFEDSFKGYDQIHFSDFEGYHFNDSTILFTLEYGTEACDFMNPIRLYSISGGKVSYIHDSFSISTDYASKYVKFILPTDSTGVENKILVVENTDYDTEEEPNLSDTTFYQYENGLFKQEKTNITDK